MPGIQLYSNKDGGCVLQSDPLRAVQMNSAALSILKKCQDGFSAENDQMLSFLDKLCQAEMIDWTPPDEPFEPFVSVVIPVYNRPDPIRDCLKSLLSLDYPTSKLEIIVVDDASTDHTPSVIRQFDSVRLIVQPRNQGQSVARNIGVQAANGELIAFLDSDCTADRSWLRELVPMFQDARVSLVGGFVDSLYRKTLLDRYEEVKSPLNMGKKKLVSANMKSVLYVPTCNMLIRKDAYLRVGGLKEDMRVGEDVDLCWRLKESGDRLLYVPKGKVYHKHRNLFFETFRRRLDYGMSEPMLHYTFRATRKRFPWQSCGAVIFFLCCLGLVTHPHVFFLVAALIAAGESFYKKRQINRMVPEPMPFHRILTSVARSHTIFAYYLTLHAIRYYLLPIAIITLMFPKIIFLTGFIAILPAGVEYVQKSPRLSFPIFCFFFWTEQLFYQLGVFCGSLKLMNFRSYGITFGNAALVKKGKSIISGTLGK